MFDLALMATPFGMDALAEEAYGVTVFGEMVFDAMFSPFPEDYERLGKTIQAMPDYFAHASAGEWGSISVDMGLGLVTGGGGAARTVVQMGSRVSRRLVGRMSRIIYGAGRGKTFNLDTSVIRSLIQGSRGNRTVRRIRRDIEELI